MLFQFYVELHSNRRRQKHLLSVLSVFVVEPASSKQLPMVDFTNNKSQNLGFFVSYRSFLSGFPVVVRKSRFRQFFRSAVFERFVAVLSS